MYYVKSSRPEFVPKGGYPDFIVSGPKYSGGPSKFGPARAGAEYVGRTVKNRYWSKPWTS